MSGTRKVSFDVRDKVKQGIDLAANAAAATLGPKGLNIVIHTDRFEVLNDGIKILQQVGDKDPLIDSGIVLVREASAKANDVAGDGSTTTAVLVKAITDEAVKALVAGAAPVEMRAGMEVAALAIVEALKAEAVQVESLEDLVDIATISCGDIGLGKTIAETVYKVGTDGLVSMEDSPEAETTGDVKTGVSLNGQLTSLFFLTNQSLQESVLEDTPVFVTDQVISSPLEMIRIMEASAATNRKQCVVIAGGIEGGALMTAILNKQNGNFSVLPVRVIGFGEQGEGVLRDAAAATGATFFSPKDGLSILDGSGNSKIAPDQLGFAAKAIATQHNLTIMGGVGDVAGRVAELKAQIKNATAFAKEGLQERVARLNSAVGMIKVGAITDTQRVERRARVEDAINATKAALKDGVVAGGGAALLRASAVTSDLTGDQEAGFRSVIRACIAPIRQIAKNSAVELDVSDLAKVKADSQLTVDFNTGKVVNARQNGVIDPLAVVVAAVSHAVVSAGIFVALGGSVTDEPEPDKK